MKHFTLVILINLFIFNTSHAELIKYVGSNWIFDNIDQVYREVQVQMIIDDQLRFLGDHNEIVTENPDGTPSRTQGDFLIYEWVVNFDGFVEHKGDGGFLYQQYDSYFSQWYSNDWYLYNSNSYAFSTPDGENYIYAGTFWTIDNDKIVASNNVTLPQLIVLSGFGHTSRFYPIDNSPSQIILEATSAPIPEPSTIFLFATGLAGLAAVGRRKKVA